MIFSDEKCLILTAFDFLFLEMPLAHINVARLDLIAKKRNNNTISCFDLYTRITSFLNSSSLTDEIEKISIRVCHLLVLPPKLGQFAPGIVAKFCSIHIYQTWKRTFTYYPKVNKSQLYTTTVTSEKTQHISTGDRAFQTLSLY